MVKDREDLEGEKKIYFSKEADEKTMVIIPDAFTFVFERFITVCFLNVLFSGTRT